MVSEDSPSDSESPVRYSDQFREIFPHYLALGMTPEQFWDMDCTLARDYRRADEIRQERKNQEMWLQGMYIYEALVDASPVFRSFSKSGTRPHPYAKKPYPIFEKTWKKDKESKQKATYEKGLAMMQKWVAETKAKKEVTNNADPN